MRGGYLRSFCEKTQLCKFNQVGACTKGRKCVFAHTEAELRAQPDLRRTKLCPNLILKGACDDKTCVFAHTKNELRRLDAPVRGRRKVVAEQAPAGYLTHAVDEVAPTLPEAGSLDGEPPCSYELDVACKSAGFDRGVSNMSECPTEASFGYGAESLTFSRSSTPEEDGPPPYSSEASDYAPTVTMGNPGPPSTCGDDLDQHLQGRSRIARNMFHKTRMCVFYETGRCKKGESCRFAHKIEELKTMPDLSCTKLCPALTAGGTCSRENCHFAHREEELRGKTLCLEAAVAPPQETARPKTVPVEDTATTTWQVRVKNTFLEVQIEEEEEEELGAHEPHRRARSAPCRLGRSSSGDSQGAEGADAPQIPRRKLPCKTWSPNADSFSRQQPQPSTRPAPAAAQCPDGSVSLALPLLR